MPCQYYVEQLCRSCSKITQDYATQLQHKQQQLTKNLADFADLQILAPVASRPLAFRNKAKMAVAGSVEQPILGVASLHQPAVDLCDCPLYLSEIRQALPKLKQFIQQANLTPYNLQTKRGELKYLLLTYHNQQFMLRFVLRSHDKVAAIRKHLPALQQLLPELTVISVNIQPQHAAILSGDEEILLSAQSVLPVRLNQVPLLLHPQSFFQTNTEVAAKLYATAADWVNQLRQQQPIATIWDLFCGVGGFGLHCADANTQLTGIEICPQAIACAQQSAAMMQLPQPQFQALDSTEFALQQHGEVDLVLVNPPRRGLGETLSTYLNQLKPQFILYSSCQQQSLLADLKQLTNYQPRKVQLFDMFPQTEHTETLLLLERIQ